MKHDEVKDEVMERQMMKPEILDFCHKLPFFEGVSPELAEEILEELEPCAGDFS